MSDTSKKLKELELEEELLDRKARLKSKKMMDERANSICVEVQQEELLKL